MSNTVNIQDVLNKKSGHKKVPKADGSAAALLGKIPSELAGLKQWVVVQVGYNEARSIQEGMDKFYKYPKMLDGSTPASSTDPNTWFDLNTVATACVKLESTANNRFYVRYLPGFVLVEGGGYYALDFDNCLDDKKADVAIGLMARFSGKCYIEGTCSLRGLRAIGRGSKVSTTCKYIKDEIDIEIYDKGRFVVMTGNHILTDVSQLTDSQDILSEFQKDLGDFECEAVNYQSLHEYKNNDEPLSLIEMARLKSALIELSIPEYLDDRNNWLFNIIVPIKRRFSYSDEGIELGIDIADEYSSGRLAGLPPSNKYYGRDDVAKNWDSVELRESGRVKTLGSLFLYAERLGWNKPLYKDLEFRTDGVYLEYISSQGQVFDLLISSSLNWKNNLDYEVLTKGNNVLKVLQAKLNNYAKILSYHPSWVGVLGYNELGGEIVKLRDSIKGVKEGYLSDIDIIRFKSWVNTEWNELDPSKDMINDAISLVASDNSFHPIRNYFSGLKTWDGHHRIERLLIDYGGAEDSEYTRFVTRKYLIGAVARVLSPGCKMDYSLCLVGEQGLMKSGFIRALAVNPDWYSETGLSVENKDLDYIIGSRWFIEFAEMVSAKKSDNESLKAFLTKQADLYRKAYDRCLTRQQRVCVFGFTGNYVQFLTDPTGSRRFWPVTINKRFDINEISKLIDQIWSEALHYYMTGEVWYPNNAYEDNLCDSAKSEFCIEDPITERIYKVLSVNHSRDDITSEELYEKLEVGRNEKWVISHINQTMIGVYKCKPAKNLNRLGGRGTQRGYLINRATIPLGGLRVITSPNEAKLEIDKGV